MTARRLPRIAAVTLLLASPLLAGCIADGLTGPGAGSSTVRLLAALPVGTPRASERDHADLVGAFGGEFSAPAPEAVLREVAGRLVAASGRPDLAVTVTILDTPKVNAFSLPSGRLYVTRGLLALASDTDEVAAVLAHEMAHVTRGHAQSRLERETRAGAGGRGPVAPAAAERSLASFSRDQELEADALGIATLAAAGYDPGAAARFLTKLGRQAGLDGRRAGRPDEAGAMLSTHPATAERIARAREAARRSAGRFAAGDPTRWLAALDGLPYGDRVADGFVRGRAFVHPRLGIAFEAPPGITLENTEAAVLGTSRDGTTRLLFDAVEAPAERPLGEVLRASWSDPIEAPSIGVLAVNGREVEIASSRGREWTFRLAAVRVGSRAYRLILAARGFAAPRLDRMRAAVLASLREVPAAEAAGLRPERIGLVTAVAGDTSRGLATRMAGAAGLDRFLILNGLDLEGPLVPGQRYKIVIE